METTDEADGTLHEPSPDRRDTMLKGLDEAIGSFSLAICLAVECEFKDLEASMRLAAADMAQELLGLMATHDGEFRTAAADRFKRLCELAGDDPSGLRPLFRARAV